AVAARNLLEGQVSVKKRVESDFTNTMSSESSEDSNSLKKPPSLMIDAGRFLFVATEYHATPAFVDSSKTRSDSQSFVWPPVMAPTKDSFLTSQWSLLEQNCVALSPISEIAEQIRGRKRLLASLTQSLISANDSVIVELPETN